MYRSGYSHALRPRNVLAIPLALLAAAVLATVLVVIGPWSSSFGQEVVRVERSWVKSTGDGEMLYLVSTEGGEVFQVSDIFLRGHFRASDVYAQLGEGEAFCVTTSGWRIPFLSTYRNISEIHGEGACA